MNTMAALIIAITFMGSGGGGDWPQDRTLQVSPGQEFTLRLKANPTTGYAWSLAEPMDGEKLALLKKDYVPSPASSGMVGSGGEEVWTFQALQGGETKLKFIYARPWLKGSGS